MKLDGGDGRQITGVLTIKLWSDGAMSVEGPIEDTEFSLAILENAKDAVRNHRARRQGQLIVPNHDVSVPDPLHPLSKVGGA